MSVTAPKTSANSETGLSAVLPPQGVKKKEHSTLSRAINPLNENTTSLPPVSIPQAPVDDLQKTFQKGLNLNTVRHQTKTEFEPARVLVSFKHATPMEEEILNYPTSPSFLNATEALISLDKNPETPVLASENVQTAPTPETIVAEKFLQAEHCFKEKKLEEALAILKSLEGMLSEGTDGFKAKFYGNLAAILCAQGKPLDAIAAYRKGLEFSGAPDTLKAGLSANLGIALRKTGQSQESVKLLQHGLTFEKISNPLKFKLLHQLGLAHTETGNSDAAIKAFHEGLKLEGTTDDEKARLFLPLAVIQSKKTPFLAIATIEKALTLTGISKEARLSLLYNLGIIQFEYRQFSKAGKAFQNAIDLQVDDHETMAKLHLYLGYAWANAGLFYQAFLAYQNGLKFDKASSSIRGSLDRHFHNGTASVPKKLLQSKP